MTRSIDYYDQHDADPLSCDACGWAGTNRDGAMETYRELLDLSCPRCGVRLLIVDYPTLDDSRAAADRGDPRAMEQLAGVEPRPGDAAVLLEQLETRLAAVERAVGARRDAAYAAVDDVAAEASDAEDELDELRRQVPRRFHHQVDAVREDLDAVDVAVGATRDALWELDPVVLTADVRETLSALRAVLG